MIASTSVFVSCQDYQDEFKDLQDQINEEHPALDKEVANLKATLAALQEQHDKDVQTLKDADKALEDLLSDEMVKANAYAVAQAEKALADAQAYADAAAAAAASQALKDAQAYADKVAAAEAQKEAQAALLAANEQAQALYKDAIDQLNKAIETINAQAAAEKSERQAADAALEAGYKAGDAALEAAFKDADAAIWVAVNKAQADLEEANKAIAAAQATADKALDLAQSNQKAIAAEVERATKAEADLKAGIEANKSAIEQEATERAAAVKSIWEAIEKANADIAANTAEIQRVNDELNKKIDAAVDRIKTLENKVATLQEEMKAAQAELSAQDARIISLEAWVGAWEPQIKDLQTRMSDAEGKIAKLQDQINQEIADRIAADNTLQGNIDAEETARKQADADLQAQVTANLDKINAEILRALAREAELAADIQTNKNDIAALTLRVAANEVEIAKLWKALGDEETARKEADEAETKARKAADLSEKTAREAADQNEASLRAQADAEEAADRIAEDLKEAANRQAQDAILKSLIESEATARQAADSLETSARIAADAALKADLLIEIGKESAARQAQDALLQSNINAEEAARIAADGELQDSIDAVAADLKALDAKVEGYYTEICDRLTADEKKIAGALENPFEVISEVDFQAAYGPVYSYEYYTPFKITVAGQIFEEGNRIVNKTYKQEPGKVYVLLAPQGNNFLGHQIYVKDEKNAAYPGYTFGTAKPAEYPEDVYFNAAWGWVTRAEEGEAVTGPIWMADVTAEDPTEEELLANIPPVTPQMPTFGFTPRYSVIAEYTQKNAELEDVKLLVWDENFDFCMTPDTYNATISEFDAPEVEWTAEAEEFDFALGFTGENDSLIYKEAITCVAAYDACEDADEKAVEYMNGLSELFATPLEYGSLEDGIEGTVKEDYSFYTFDFRYEVYDVKGNVVLDDTLSITFAPAITATSQVIVIEDTPESGEIQFTEAYDIDPTILWNDLLPDVACTKLTATLKALSGVEADKMMTFCIGDGGLLWDAHANAGKSDDYTKADIAGIKKLSVAYDPALLSQFTEYKYAVQINYQNIVISKDTVIFKMNRPTGHDLTLEKITSAWNPAKTQTIVWAQKGDLNGTYNNAWYKFQGSFTNILDYLTPVDPCKCTLVFSDSTDYTAAAGFEVVTMPAADNTFQIDVPAVAVRQNAVNKELSFSVLNEEGHWYNLAYGTNVYGLESLYGGESKFDIAFCSPIYYDGVKYNWEEGYYYGGCKMKKDEYRIGFPRQKKTISSADFEGSNDPSTSVVDPIVYFGAVRDERILDVKVVMAESVPEFISNKYPAPNYVINDKTNLKLFGVQPTITDTGLEFQTYDEQPSLQSIPVFYYNLQVVDVWGCVKNYPFAVVLDPNTPMN